MSDHTSKDFFGDEYTTYYKDGSTSHTIKDSYGDGYTTFHDDWSTSHTSTSHTIKDSYGDGATTFHEDGSISHTIKDSYGDGYTTFHDDGSITHTIKDPYGNGYITYNNNGDYSVAYADVYDDYSVSPPHPGILGPLGIFFTILFSCAAGFMLWWDMIMFSPVLFAIWAVVLAVGVIERNRHNDYKEQDTWHTWTLLLATLMGIYLLYNRADAPGETLYVAAHYAIPVVYMVLMVLLCTRATGAQVHDWIVYLFVILMLAAWFMTIYTHFAGYGEFISVVLDIIFGIILIISLFTALSCIKEHRLAILPVFAVAYAVNFVGYRVTGFIGFYIIKDFIMGLF